MALPEPTCSQTPDGTFLLESTLADGTRLVAVILPEDVDEIAGPLSTDPPSPEERRRRVQVARLLGEMELRRQAEERPSA